MQDQEDIVEQEVTPCSPNTVYKSDGVQCMDGVPVLCGNVFPRCYVCPRAVVT